MHDDPHRSRAVYPEDEEPFLETEPSSPVPRGMDMEVFDEGERVGVGVFLEGRGGWATDCFDDGVPGPGELEVVRRLGEGTYAIVYLVKEVLYDPTTDRDAIGREGLTNHQSRKASHHSSQSQSHSRKSSYPGSFPQSNGASGGGGGGGYGGGATYDDEDFDGLNDEVFMDEDPFLPAPPPTYGREFALKCLCKKDLSEELVEVQRGEAVLHRRLPVHENIVQLYGAYETDDWLFLVLEYCPGQDLYYWLDERADSSEALYDLHSRAVSPFQSPSTLSQPSYDQTPPSPSLLGATANASLLSRRRLRLISRMFSQMCSAVEACHEVGISHRDIKPENFIVSDGRTEGTTKVVVKITDWGLGTGETQCEDFDCGSKPYMAYECRNNLQPTYDPRQADIWSLGLVLLNLLFHRNPWSDPSLSDPDFAAYVSDPMGFLQDRFEGIGEDVARFLSTKVFCDVLEREENGEMRRRVSAGDFGKWAGKLVVLMGEGKRKRASVSDNTFPLMSSLSRMGPPRNPHAPTTPSLLSQYAPTNAVFASPKQSLDELPSNDGRDELPSITEQSESFRATPPAFPDHLTNRRSVTPPLPVSTLQSSPTWSPPSTPKREMLMFGGDEDDEPLPSPSFSDQVLPEVNEAPSTPTRPGMDARQSSSGLSGMSGLSLEEEEEHEEEARDKLPPSLFAVPEQHSARSDTLATTADAGTSTDTGSETLTDAQKEAKSKRRKRGARKGRSAAATPASPGAVTALPTVEEMRDQTLTELAAASQDLARALSKTVGTSSGRSVGAQSTPSLLSKGAPAAAAAAAPAAKGGMFGRMRGLVMDGNQELNALKQRAMQRDADTYSAPAKMQGGRSGPGVHSAASYGASSHGSWSADDTGPSRGRSGAEDHWSSATSRRERQQQHRRRVGSPSSSTRHGSASTTTTPLTSFSSVASQDWRSKVPGPPFAPSNSHSRTRTTRLKDAAVDTADFEAALASSAPSSPPMQTTPKVVPAALPPPPAVRATLPPPPATLRSTLPPPVQTTTNNLARPVVIGSTPPVQADTPPPTVKANKLGKLLNSISVFNRSQERS